MAEQKSEGAALKPDVQTDTKTANLGPGNSDETRRLAQDLPEKDAVQKAYKDALTAEDQHKEARGYLKAAEESPDAMDTPSGHGLKVAAGESNDTLRGEKYARAKAERRWGWTPPA
jgi:hypothetical protein